MKIQYIVVPVLLLSLASCSASESAIGTAVQQTLELQTPVIKQVQQEVTRVVEVTREVERVVEVTREVERVVEVTREVERVVEVTREVERVIEATQVVDREVTATPIPVALPTDTPSATELGTRNNPHPVGEAAAITKDGKLNFALTITEVIRGDAAYQRIVQANQFNDPAPQGFEYVLVHVEAAYTGEDQGMLQMDKNPFAVVTKGRVIRYADTLMYNPCCIVPELNLSIFQGGTGDGWIALPVAVDDPTPLLVIGLKDDGTGGYYFSLTP